MTEAQLQAAVLELARLLGWRVAHFRPARTVTGWRTPVAADGAGFPDLCLVRERVLFRELKAERGAPSSEQLAWLDALTAAGADAGIWRPSDWTAGLIEAELRGLVVGEQAVLREIEDLLAEGVLVERAPEWRQ